LEHVLELIVLCRYFISGDGIFFLLTKRREYIRFQGKELSSNTPFSKKEFVLALDATFWRNDAFLLQIILECFIYSFTSQWTCLIITSSSNKVISKNIVITNAISNLSNHSIKSNCFCELGNSVFPMYELVNYNKLTLS
jgi:hypothetical protein